MTDQWLSDVFSKVSARVAKWEEWEKSDALRRSEQLLCEANQARGGEDAGTVKKEEELTIRMAERAHTMRLLASAMKKTLPPKLLQELIDHFDPLAAFLREMKP